MAVKKSARRGVKKTMKKTVKKGMKKAVNKDSKKVVKKDTRKNKRKITKTAKRIVKKNVKKSVKNDSRKITKGAKRIVKKSTRKNKRKIVKGAKRIVKKNVKKSVKNDSRKIVKTKSNPSTLFKKATVTTTTDSNKILQREIMAMSKIFSENQKILVSMKGMIDTLTSTLEHVQKQSKQISMIEDDTQKLYAGLSQVRTQSNLINKINDQTSRLENELVRISGEQKSSGPQRSVKQTTYNTNSTENHPETINKILQGIDKIKNELVKISGKTDTFLAVSSEIDSLKNSIKEISEKAAKTDTGSHVIKNLRQELKGIAEGASSIANLNEGIGAIKDAIDTISLSSKTLKVDAMEQTVSELKQQIEAASAKVDSTDKQSMESIREIAEKINRIESKMDSLSHGTDSTALVEEGFKSVQKEISSLRQNTLERTDGIEQKISSVSDALKEQKATTTTTESNKKFDILLQDLQSISKGIAAVTTATDKTPDSQSKEMTALLRLSEYQSIIRMNTESKYGVAKDIEGMAKQTADIASLFDSVITESGEKMQLPHKVKQWAISKMLDCADKWELRFSDVYSILTGAIGKDALKESIAIRQVKDIYGVKAADEIKKELNIS